MLLALPSIGAQAQVEHGKASYYSRQLRGKRTASGEPLSATAYTCAHRTHPFGTYLRVKNVDNGREVVVVVNDRGPFVRGRVVDVSYAAAKELGMIARGLCNVEIEPVAASARPSPLLPLDEDSIAALWDTFFVPLLPDTLPAAAPFFP